MLDVKYYKDYRHNYLIISDNGRLSENVYQRRMVTENQIKGLLVCQEKYINGDILLYYEITSKQSLLSIYDNKNIGIEELRKFFIQLKLVNDILQKYLLDESGLVLLPEYIFQNIETDEYFFIYYPDPEEGTFSQLIDFFMSKVDSEDLKAVEIVYKIADLIHGEQFAPDEVLKWFQPDMEEGGYDTNYDYKAGRNEEHEYDDEEAYQFQQSEDEIMKLEDCERNKSWIRRIFSFLFKKKKRKVFSKKSDEEYCYINTYEDTASKLEADTGNTIFVPWLENCENKLYSMDRKNKCHIDLSELPLTVGKLAGAVDFVINDASISRMHAKLFRKENKVYITDLNSTNGTFRNGMRLSPNASDMIEPGDEIRLGKLKFIYR